ncbi:hypothetical protein SS50377_22684 [Spironucleus salmonicida]|uniref:Uncharacterized protein n=1 Tax=Spironucleus salmonicida TaxID=348837 RepID=V6M6H3_9EUKA|nr:hypothetical protein SS50377_22684 [Spironucleus salmonicida]|eukprot:EST49004.1 Hypothetical protein SS50377_10774 [Spironucleus salmonicida]
MNIDYDSSVVDYCGKTVQLSKVEKEIIILNPCQVQFNNQMLKESLDLREFRAIQIVDNDHCLIDYSTILPQSLPIIFLNCNIYQRLCFFGQALLRCFKVLVIQNKSQVDLGLTNAAICEINNVAQIAITKALSIQTLLINGITLIFNQNFCINDGKVFTQYPIQPVSITLSNSQLSKFPDNFLNYCNFIRCDDSSQENSNRVLSNMCHGAILHLGEIINYTFIQSTEDIYFQKAENISIISNEPFLIYFQNFKTIEIQEKYQILYTPILLFQSSFNGVIIVKDKVESFQLVGLERQSHFIQQLDINFAQINQMLFPSIMSIDSITILGSRVQSVIFGSDPIQQIVYDNIYTALNQFRNLRKVNICCHYPCPNVGNRFEEIKEIKIGENIDRLIELSITDYHVEKLEILCPVESYELENTKIHNFLYAYPDQFRRLTIKQKEQELSQEEQKYKENIGNDSYLVNQLINCSSLEYLILEYIFISCIQVDIIFNALCIFDPKLVIINNINKLMIPEHIYIQKQNKFTQIGYLQVINRKQNNMVSLSYYNQSLKNLNLTASTTSLELCQSSVKSYTQSQLQNLNTLNLSNTDCQIIYDAKNIKHLILNKIDTEIPITSKLISLNLYRCNINFNIQLNDNLLILKEIIIGASCFQKESLGNIYTLLSHLPLLEVLKIQGFMEQLKNNYIELYLSPSLVVLHLIDIAVRTLYVTTLPNLKSLKLCDLQVTNSIYTVIKTRSITNIYIKYVYIAVSPYQLESLFLRSFTIRENLKFYILAKAYCYYLCKKGTVYALAPRESWEPISSDDQFVCDREVSLPYALTIYINFAQFPYKLRRNAALGSASRE